MHRHVDLAIAALAGRQAGAFAYEQALAAGAPRPLIDRRIDAGVWLRRYEGALVLPGWPDTFEQRVWLARCALGDRSAISLRAAGRVHGLMSMARVAGAQYTIPHGAHRRLAGVSVHQSRAFDLLEIVTKDGLPPVTSVAQTLLDLAAITKRGSLKLITEDAAIRRLVTYEQIDARLGVMAARGRRGIPRMASVVGELWTGTAVPDSQLEAAMLQLFDINGVPRPVVHAPLPGRSPVDGIVDFWLPPPLLILETDGRAWHARIQQARKDAERDHQAARAGVQTLRFHHEHVVGDPEGTWATIEQVCAARRRLLAA